MKKFLIALSASIFFMCCKRQPASSDTTAENVVNSNVHVIDSNKLVLNNDTSLINQGLYQYTFTGNAPSFFTNDIIVGRTDGGYLRKILSVTNQPNKIILNTTQGNLEDVFSKASFGFTTNMDSLSRVQGGYQLDLSNITLFQSGPVSLKLTSGNIKFDADWKFDLKIENFDLKYFEMSCRNAQVNAQFNLNASISQAVALVDKTTSLKNLSKTFFYVVPGTLLPVYVKLELDFICKYSLSASAVVNRNITITSNNSMDLGIVYSNDQWMPVYNKASSSSVTTSNLSGNATVAVNFAILPTVSVRFYRVIGPYLSSGIKELVKGTVGSPDPDWDLYVGAWLNTVLGLKAQVFTKKNIRFQY